jgi:hypothetical protein
MCLTEIFIEELNKMKIKKLALIALGCLGTFTAYANCPSPESINLDRSGMVSGKDENGTMWAGTFDKKNFDKFESQKHDLIFNIIVSKDDDALVTKTETVDVVGSVECKYTFGIPSMEVPDNTPYEPLAIISLYPPNKTLTVDILQSNIMYKDEVSGVENGWVALRKSKYYYCGGTRELHKFKNFNITNCPFKLNK